MIVEKSGVFTAKTSYDATYDYLSDLAAVVECLPDEVHSVEPRDDDGLNLVADVGPGAYRTQVKFRIAVEETDADGRTLTYTGHGLAPRSKVDLHGQFVLSEVDDGTEVQWSGQADVGGVIASLNADITRTTAHEKIARTIEKIESTLNDHQRADA
ncbi:SRPBCC domain-containing protein [Salinigranum sp. GCM10025319]|uniref:SRPBCC domain-containing protein n=1 Tax=Salinigranum sp. GCM10025319 TaxID=3252687 RepID=UPI0036189116